MYFRGENAHRNSNDVVHESNQSQIDEEIRDQVMVGVIAQPVTMENANEAEVAKNDDEGKAADKAINHRPSRSKTKHKMNQDQSKTNNAGRTVVDRRTLRYADSNASRIGQLV